MPGLRVTFGPFTLDTDQRRLLRDGADVPLTPKAFDLLALLVERRPTALSKQDILDAVWQGTFVTENNLATTIRDLRSALDDDASAPRYIRTVYAHGYAFVGDAAEGAAPAPATDWRILHASRELTLRAGENLVGRDAAIVIDAHTVSRQHASLMVENGRLFCRDLASKNGTWVRNEPATTAIEVLDGDEIRLGSVVVVARRARALASTQTVERD